MSVQTEIFKWVQGFEPWKQELFIRAAAAPELAPEDVGAVADMVLGGQEGVSRPREIEREHLIQTDGVDEPMVIECVSGLRNVNALQDGQTLSFEPQGVNVIWGANGAGKTGYSRVLKKAGRALYEEEVLSNVYLDEDQAPKATLVVKIGDAQHSEELDLNGEPPPILARIHIVDYRVGEIYLTKETEVDYVPASLSSLSRLANGLTAVKAELQLRRDEVRVREVDPRLFGDGTQAANAVAALDAESTEAEIRTLAELSEEEKQKRDSLRETLAAIDAKQAPTLRAAAEREIAAAKKLGDDLSRVAESLGAHALETVREREKALREAHEAAELAARQFDGQPLGSIGSGPWYLMWSAAREYAIHLGQSLPPDHDPAHCPLCMQELDGPARDRLRTLEEFVAGDVNARQKKLQEEKVEAIAGLPDVDVIRDRNQGAIELLGGESGELGALVAGWLDSANDHLSRIRTGETTDLDPLPPPPDLSSWEKARHDVVQRHADIEADENSRKARLELRDLDGRHGLSEHLEEVLARLNGLKEVARIQAAISATGTGGVSLKVRTFSKELIQGGLEQALNRQLKALEFRDIEVVPTTRSVRGQPVAGLAFKTVQGVPLTAVLSQGEQRRLALAMFLAEMEVRSDASPVVFDDPTSSIDQEGRRRIARTLLRLGESRQVIVFTHELSLVRDLQRFENSACGVAAQHIRRVGKTVGHVQPSLPWEGLSAKERNGQLKNLLVVIKKEHEKNDAEVYAPQAAQFCNLLRAAFERAVEDLVLGGVITRRSDDVHTKQLRALSWSDEICDLVDRGMSETSPWVHDRPLADGDSPPGPDELKEGLDVLGALLEKTGEMKKTREDADKQEKSKEKAKLRSIDFLPSGDGASLERKLKSVPDLNVAPKVDIPKKAAPPSEAEQLEFD